MKVCLVISCDGTAQQVHFCLCLSVCVSVCLSIVHFKTEILPVWSLFGPCLVPVWSLFDAVHYVSHYFGHYVVRYAV